MASAAKLFSFLFFLASLLFSQQAQARENQFFSKVANVNNHNNYEKEIPIAETPLKKQEQEPAFIPETQSGYGLDGLYGHGSGQLPPTPTNTVGHYTTTNTGAPYTTTTTGAPYTTTNGAQFTTNNNNLPYTAESEKEQQHTNKYPQTYNAQLIPSKNNFNNHVGPAPPSDTRLTQSSYTTPTNYQSNNYYDAEKQGTSDTRFLKKGKDYYSAAKALSSCHKLRLVLISTTLLCLIYLS
ncbi:protein E6 [Prunus persica]|uniref:protein E6 n=1 Tax=Prunus persica TaxID=3760 RepID=UPI0009AB5F39|nr:protein E6 [Prunus persica]